MTKGTNTTFRKPAGDEADKSRDRALSRELLAFAGKRLAGMKWLLTVPEEQEGQ